MKAVIGTKLGMVSLITPDGTLQAVTLIQAGPIQVTQVRTEEKDGYQAVQVGFGKAKLGKSQAGHQKAAGSQATHLREFRTQDEHSVGEQFDVSVFSEGDTVKVSGVSKGKGFAGTVKRHHFKRGPKTHGSSNYRQPGSIGSMYPQKVLKGKRMAGRMGSKRASVRNLKVVLIDKDQHVIGVIGSVPGARKGLVTVEEIGS